MDLCKKEMRNAYRVLVGNPERISFAGTGHRCEKNIDMDLKGIECEDVEWIFLSEGRVQ
jgi:hypothetical protein